MNPLIDPTGQFTQPQWKPTRLVMELEQEDEQGRMIVPFTQVTYVRNVEEQQQPKGGGAK